MEMNPYIERGLLVCRETGEVVRPPEEPVCYLCMYGQRGHLAQRSTDGLILSMNNLKQVKQRIAECKETVSFLEDAIGRYQDELLRLTGTIPDHLQEALRELHCMSRDRKV